MSRKSEKKEKRKHFDPEIDPAFLQEMILACRCVVKHSSNADIDLYINDEKLRAAMDRWLYIICDSASNLSQEVLNRHPDVEWQKVIDMRIWLAHRYMDLDPEIAWDSIVNEVPVVLASLEADPFFPSTSR
jgi:uncharacterized protein with HEPN domain